MTRSDDRNDAIDRLSRVQKESLPPDGGDRYNRLIFEKSPYLLQHAENPVDWYPWGEEAFERARREDRPVFLSIGYSTCHWCHVMAHESFEDEEVAAVLNRHFVPVKVDREERPDVDGVYMNVCQMMTGSGGWPLNLLLTPDRKPFFAATYLPKHPRGGIAGIIPLLEKIAGLWRTDRDRLLQTGNEVAEVLQRLDLEDGGESPITDQLLHKAYEQFLERFDRRFAGFGGAPKFPAPHTLSLLLRIGRRTWEEKARTMALQTLQAMRLGGIYDQIGFGLHRYSVDAQWLVPHFEKMLYDQALTALAALDAFQSTGSDFFGQFAKEILEYIRRDLSTPEGGFCCGEDADSEGEEGTFYLWSPAQVKDVLGEELGTIFCRSYGITEEGNFEGKSIPHLQEDLTALAARVGVAAQELSTLLGEARRRLFAAREERVRPHRDDKILTAWNGLAIAALARGGAVLGDPELLGSAAAAARFILHAVRTPQGRLLRRYRAGEAAIPGFLEDYAFFVWGLIELYQGGFDSRHLKEAVELTREMEELFADGQGTFFDTGADAEAVLTRGRSLQDGALPSGLSVAALNLLRLSDLTGDGSMGERGERLLKRLLTQVEQYPSAFAQTLIALDYALGPRRQVVLAPGSGGEFPADLLTVVRTRFLPRTVVLLHCPDDKTLEQIAPAVIGKGPVEGGSAAWLCLNRACRPPATSAAELEAHLTD